MKNLILSAVIVAGLAISAFTFCGFVSSAFVPTTTKAIVIPDSVTTADGLFNARNQWVTSGVTRTTYTKDSTCVILLTLPEFKVGHNVIECAPNPKGVSAYGVLYGNGDASSATYICTYTMPVLLAE